MSAGAKIKQAFKRKKNSDSDDDNSDKSEASGSSDAENEDGDSDDNRSNNSDEEVPARKKAKSSSSSEGATKPKGIKKLDRLEEARKAFKWWEAPKLKDGVHWKSLEHTGVVFAPPYEKHNVPLYYDGNPVQLTLEQEEVASFYAAIPDDGPQLGNPKTRPVFQKNFFADFKKLLGPDQSVIKRFDLCDFTAIRHHLTLKKNLKKAATVEEKEAAKARRDVLQLKHGYALIDGRIEKVRNPVPIRVCFYQNSLHYCVYNFRWAIIIWNPPVSLEVAANTP
jgi:DNA topoisomerase-1